MTDVPTSEGVVDQAMTERFAKAYAHEVMSASVNAIYEAAAELRKEFPHLPRAELVATITQSLERGTTPGGIKVWVDHWAEIYASGERDEG